MSIRDILVYADTKDHASVAATAACNLCEKHTAKVTGLFVNTHQELPKVSPLSGKGKLATIDVSDGKVRDSRAAFDAVFEDTPIDTYWRERDGLAGPKIIEELPYRDLIVMARHSQHDPDFYGSMISQVILSSLSPVLLVPQTTEPKYIGQHILVAWNGTLQASRALRSAMPLLREAGKVVVIGTHELGEDLPITTHVNQAVEYLARHGIRVHSKIESGDGWDDGTLLLRYATRSDASMIVMGGWGHSRLLEFVLGGTTRHVVTTANIPVWLHH